MARDGKQKAAEKKIPDGIPAGHAVTLEETKIAGITEAYSEERDLANQLLGQAQMAIAVSKLTTVVGLTKLQHIKETKLYKAFAGKTVILPGGENRKLVGTWEEYCELLGTSRQKVDEDLTNLRAFGEEAMDNLTRIGAGYRELRQLRKLPADERTALIEAAKTGDKDELLDIAESLIVKHAKEKEALTKDLTEATETYEAQGAVLKQKDETLNKLEKQLHKLQNRAGEHKAKNPRAKGSVENGNNRVECLFESRLMYEPVENVDELNVAAEAWYNAYNADAIPNYDARLHRKYMAEPTARYALWQMIRREQLRILPNVEMCRLLLSADPIARKVDGELTISFKHPGPKIKLHYDVGHIPGVFIGAMVRVSPLVYGENQVLVTVTDYKNEETTHIVSPVASDAGGFRADGAVFGDEYKCRAAR